jgi:tetratricopeptide (TPR) repeat protein
MKIYLFVIFLLPSISTTGQDLRNTEWIKIDAKRKDGSKILDRSNIKESYLEYLFKETTVTIILGSSLNFEKDFSINGETLSIGNNLTYQIDILNNSTLVLTEISKDEMSPDKINTLTFINKNFYFKYLLQNNQIQFISDTLVQCSDRFSPTYKNGYVHELFQYQFDETNYILEGYFVVSPNGTIEEIQVVSNNKFSDKEINKVKKILSGTSGSWVIPKDADSLYFKINFELGSIYRRRVSGVDFSLHSKHIRQSKHARLTPQEEAQANLFFQKGLKFSLNGKDEKAIIEFQKVTSIDSLYLDAYYNMAFLYFKRNDKKSACDIWRKLESLEQKQAETFYKENCN